MSPPRPPEIRVLAGPPWLRAGLAEIGADPALRAYGAMLALVHVVTWAHWGFAWAGDIPAWLSDGSTPVCWPFFERCGDYRVLGEGAWRALLAVYGLTGVAGAIAFLARRIGVACGTLALLSLFKWCVLAQDYRLGGNYHYMAFISTLAFLVVPGKRDIGRYLVVAYYLAAASLKLNHDWLSGEALHRVVLFHGPLLRVATTYVVVLETVVVLGLLAARSVVFWGAAAQLAAFHLYSVTNIGTPYPLFMGCLLTIFPLARLLGRELEPRAGPLVRLLLGRTPVSHRVVLGLFFAAQLVPALHRGDPALTGRGRAFALTMFDARTICQTLALARPRPGRFEELSFADVQLAPRIHCDPTVFASLARSACTRLRRGSPRAELDLYVVARRAADPGLTPLVEAPAACSHPPEASIWRAMEFVRP